MKLLPQLLNSAFCRFAGGSGGREPPFSLARKQQRGYSLRIAACRAKKREIPHAGQKEAMAENPPGADLKEKPGMSPGQSRRGLLISLIAAPLLLAAGGGAAIYMVPSVGNVAKILFRPPAPSPDANHPNFVTLPEITITLPNGGRPRQLKITIALELAKIQNNGKPEDIISPRLYDQLVTYLRTLRDSDIDGGIAIDRLRGDLYRRLTLLLGDGVVRDVLITSFVVA
jgi:flagellar protein FliL